MLKGILNEIWTMLERGANEFNDPFHWPILGTIGNEGCHQRTVILRQLIMPERILVCYTDARAPKVQEISAFNKISWLFYHPKKKIQLRLIGQAKLHTNDKFADEQWSNTGITTRINFCATNPPGTPVDKPMSGLPDFMINKLPSLLESERGRRNFMAISCRIDLIDYLSLSILGNKRARFEWNEEKLSATWLVP